MSNVQILRFAQDDKHSFACHPERSEGSAPAFEVTNG
jgi:hypothetical protein